MSSLRKVLLLCAIGFAIWKYAPWPSREIVFQEQNCQCKIPWNWTFKDNPQFTMEASRPYGGTIIIAAKPITTPVRVADPGFQQAKKEALISKGFEFVSENQSPFQGRDAYTCITRKTINGIWVYTRSLFFTAGNFRYDLVTSVKGVDPGEDSQLQEAVNSFSVLNP
jgi:hypothetical protein